MPATELRDLSTDVSQIEIRSAEGETPPGFTGYAAVFNREAPIGNPFKWGFIERIAPGAFSRTIRNTDQRFLIDHDPSKLVARRSAGDLRLKDDDPFGVLADADLDMDLSYVRDLARNLEKRRITGMSFQFSVREDQWDLEKRTNSLGEDVDVEVRTLIEIEVPEVSAVTFPAYQETTAALRAVSFRDDPDPLGRRGEFFQEHDIRRPGESTAELKAAGTGGSTLQTVHVDLLMGSWSARTGLAL